MDSEMRLYRKLAAKEAGYSIILLPITLPLCALRVAGEWADDMFRKLDTPAYRWRNHREEIERSWIRAARRKREAERAADQP